MYTIQSKACIKSLDEFHQAKTQCHLHHTTGMHSIRFSGMTAHAESMPWRGVA